MSTKLIEVKLTDKAQVELKVDQSHLLCCCDCGLIHGFKITFADEWSKENGWLMLKVWRDAKETSKERRKQRRALINDKRLLANYIHNVQSDVRALVLLLSRKKKTKARTRGAGKKGA